MRSPTSDSNHTRSSRLSFNLYYFATGHAQRDSEPELEFMLDTGASCSIINYRTFWEISQFQHPIMVHRSNNLTKTYSGQVVPMIGYATIEFSYDPNGKNSFPLTVWITEMKTQNLLLMDSCQNQASGIHFDLPGFELRQPQKLFVMEVFTRTKFFLTFLEFQQFGYTTLCTLTLKAPDVGSTRLATQNLYFFLDQLFKPTRNLCPHVLFLLISSALSLNRLFQYSLKITKTIR